MAKYKIIPSSRTIEQSPISIGHKAEKGVEAIEFDLTAWVETYGSGTLTVIMQRWGDEIPYPIALKIDENNKATWTLSDTDTAKAGMAYAQLNYIVGDEVVKKSDIYTFRVMDSLTGEGDPPEAYESWLEHLQHLAAEAMAEVLDIEGIPTDKTLTVDGGIADAKATGDALSALEDQFTEETDQLKADLNATNGDINKLIGNIQGTWNLGGMYSATGIEYNSSNRIRTPFIKVNPGDTIQIANPDTTLELSVFEFASNAPTTTGTNERLQIRYVGSSVKKVTLGNSTNYIRLQLPTEDTLKGDDLLLYTKNSAVFDSIAEVSEDLSETLGDLKADLFYGIDFAKKYFDFSTVTDNGVSFTWHAKKRTCKVSGTATSAVANDVLCEGELPEGIRQGDEFLLRFKLDKIEESIGVRVHFFDSNGNLLLNKYSTLHKIGNASADIPFKVPAGSATWRVKIYVLYSASDPISVDATVTRLQLFKTTPRKMEVPLIVSFIDDDTTNDTYVTRFHDSCCHNGIKGNYAVITDRIGDTTSLEKLLQYEDEGFGMLIHAKDQSPTRTPYWTPKDEQGNPRTHTSEELNQCRANLNAGLRKMREDGFVNYNYWVTPGGHHEDGIIEMAKQSGLECMIPTNNGRYNSMQDCTKWIIRRISLGNTEQSGAAENLQFVKDKINEAVAAGGGWLIITTHYNEGWSSTDTWDDTLDSNGYPVGYERFNEIAQYAISAGMVPMSIPQAWKYYCPIIEANHSEYQRDIT